MVLVGWGRRRITYPCKNLVRQKSLREDVPAGLSLEFPLCLNICEHESMGHKN